MPSDALNILVRASTVDSYGPPNAIILFRLSADPTGVPLLRVGRPAKPAPPWAREWWLGRLRCPGAGGRDLGGGGPNCVQCEGVRRGAVCVRPEGETDRQRELHSSGGGPARAVEDGPPGRHAGPIPTTEDAQLVAGQLSLKLN